MCCVQGVVSLTGRGFVMEKTRQMAVVSFAGGGTAGILELVCVIPWFTLLPSFLKNIKFLLTKYGN